MGKFAVRLLYMLILLGCALIPFVTKSRFQLTRLGLTNDESINEPLHIWHTWPVPHAQALDQIIDGFKITHPDITMIVEYVPIEDFVDEFFNAEGIGIVPDLIIGMDTTTITELIGDEYLGDIQISYLSDLSLIDVEVDRLLPEAVDALTVNNRLYALPFAGHTKVLFYNKNLVAQPATTLDELMDAVERGQQVAFSTDWYHAYWGIRAFGGTVFDEEGNVHVDEGFIEWLTWLQGTQLNPYFQSSISYKESYDAFLDGQIAYLIGNSLDLPHLQNGVGTDVVGMTLLPTAGEHRGSFLELETVVMTASSIQHENAGAFMRFLINQTQQRRLAISELGFIPMQQEIVFDKDIAPFASVLLNQRELGTIVALENVFVRDVLSGVGTLIHTQLLEGVLTPEKGAIQLYEDVSQSGASAEGRVFTGLLPDDAYYREGSFESIFSLSYLNQENAGRNFDSRFGHFELSHAGLDEADIEVLLNIGRKIRLFAGRTVIQTGVTRLLLIGAAMGLVGMLIWRLPPRLFQSRHNAIQQLSPFRIRLLYRSFFLVLSLGISLLILWAFRHSFFYQYAWIGVIQYFFDVNSWIFVWLIIFAALADCIILPPERAPTSSRIGKSVRFCIRLLRAATFPILCSTAFFFIADNVRINIRPGLASAAGDIFFLGTLYAVIATLVREVFEAQDARRFVNRVLRPSVGTLLLISLISSLSDIRLVADVILTHLFNSPVTTRAFFFGTIGLYLWVGLLYGVQNFFQWMLVQITDDDPGAIEATLTLIRYVMLIIGVGYVVNLFRFDATAIAAITGGLSVGIGFGLREILSNFISGLLLLTEQTLNPGDVVEVEGQLSVVESYSIRATTVRTRNNEEMIIPNQTFITSMFKTYTGTDNKVRIELTVQTDCAIKPTRVIEILRDAALEQTFVLDDPQPAVHLLDYGNNVATFKLRVWINELWREEAIMSDIKVAVWDALQKHNVALPFPEMELLFPKPVSLVSAEK